MYGRCYYISELVLGARPRLLLLVRVLQYLDLLVRRLLLRDELLAHVGCLLGRDLVLDGAPVSR